MFETWVAYNFFPLFHLWELLFYWLLVTLVAALNKTAAIDLFTDTAAILNLLI